VRNRRTLVHNFCHRPISCALDCVRARTKLSNQRHRRAHPDIRRFGHLDFETISVASEPIGTKSAENLFPKIFANVYVSARGCGRFTTEAAHESAKVRVHVDYPYPSLPRRLPPEAGRQSDTAAGENCPAFSFTTRLRRVVHRPRASFPLAG
jgi:hypothetical protein